MTDTIIIFNTDSTMDEIDSKSEKHDTFSEMMQYDNKHIFTHSTIDTILFQQILPYITPIIEFIPNSPLSKVIETSTRNKIVYKTEYDIMCLYSEKEIEIRVSKFSYINVIGFKVNKNLDRTKNIDSYLHVKKADIIKSGDVSLINSRTDKYYVFNKQLKFIMPDVNKLDIRNNSIYFNTDNKFILNIIINAIKSAREYYDTNVKILHATIHKQALRILYDKNDKVEIIKKIPKCSKIINELGNITKKSFCYEFPQNILHDIYNRGYYIYYNKLQLTNDTNILNEIKYNGRIDQIDYTKRLEWFKKNHIAMNKFKMPLDKITKEQLLIVNKAYERTLKQSTIKEMEIVYSLSRAMDNDDKLEIKANLEKLEKLDKLDNAKNFSYIKIKGINLVCRHVITKANLLLQDYKNMAEKNKYIRNELISKYCDTSITDGYYCKICSEKLIEMEIEFNIPQEGYSRNEFDPLYMNIYREVTYIVNNFLEFGNTHMHNIYNIIGNISDILKNEIYTIQTNLLKVKTLGKENINTTLNIYIYIYAFAFISQLIYTNDFISFKRNLFKVGGKQSPLIEISLAETNVDKVKKGDISPLVEIPSDNKIDKVLASKVIKSNKNVHNIQSIINMALSILRKIKYKDIQDSKIISLATVTSIFLKAYRWIIKINYSVIVDPSASYWDTNNSIIAYLLYPHNLQKSPLIDTDNFIAAMGRSRKDINDHLKSKGIYSTIIKPMQWTDDKYYNDSLLSVYEYISENLYLENVLAIKSNLIDFYKKYEYLHELEDKKIKNIKLRRLTPKFKVLTIPYISVNKNPKFKSCSGDDIFVYQTKGGKLVQLSQHDIKKWLDEKNYEKLNEFKTYTLVEIICLHKKIDKNDEKVPFYDFYETKCPLGGLHDFKPQCIKCGITQTIIQTLDKKYYKKYLSIYAAIRKKEYERLKTLSYKPKVVKLKTFPKWDVDMTLIQKLANILNISPNIIYNLGLSENKDYSSKVFAKTNLSVGMSDDEIIKQNNTLYDYYLFIIRSYHLSINSEFLNDLPIYLKDFLATYGKSLKKLPIINKDFINKYIYYKKTLKPHTFNNFLLASISELLLSILNAFNTISLKSLGEAYIKMLFDRLIIFEKKISKFDIRKVLKRTSDANIGNLMADENLVELEFADDADADADIVDEVEEKEIDDNADEKDIQLEQPTNEFSINDIDVEMDEDNLYKDVADKLN